jgi:hypothetical protein
VTTPALTSREALAEAIWAAVLWYSSPDCGPGAAAPYEALFDAVCAERDYSAALRLVADAVAAGAVRAGDLPALPERGRM